jgi:glycosyltransferase involved in cell wall biosynthesis
MKVLHLIPNLDFGNAAKQLTLLVPALAASGIHCRVAVMAGKGPFTRALESANVALDFLDWKRWIEPQPFLRLRQILQRFSPDIIHCWRRESIRVLAIIGGRKFGARVISSCIGNPLNGLTGKLETWLSNAVNKLVFQWPSELEKWNSCVQLEKLCRIPPGIDSIGTSASAGNLDALESVTKGSKIILCIGPLEPSKGIKEGIWAFHILGFLFPDLRLVLIGEGPDRARLTRISKTVFTDRIIFLGPHMDPRAVLTRADVVWVPSLEPRGFNVALEAMAAGKPVVASRLPGLADIIADGEAGILVPPGDKVSLARQTRLLLEDPIRSRQLAEAAQRRAREIFSVESMAQAYRSLYESVLNSG